MTWTQLSTLAFAIISAMWMLFRWGLDAKLRSVESQLKAILEKIGKLDDHERQITEMQTVMRINGCMEGRCGKGHNAN